jgi:hypothetical protein
MTTHLASRLLASVAILALATVSPVAVGQPDATEIADPEAQAERTPVDPVVALRSADATDEERRTAAASLVAERRQDALAQALAGGAPPASVLAIADALAGLRVDDASDGLVRAVGGALGRDDLSLAARAAVLNFMQRFRTRAAIRPVIESLTIVSDDESVTMTCEALARQTGRGDLGNDPGAWRQWWSGVEWLTEAEWRTRLAEAHARRADGLRTERDDLERRWLDAMRRLHGLTPPESRSALIRDLLVDNSPAARRLGLEFVEQALLNARSLDPAVNRLAVERIGDPDPTVRTMAASVAARTNPEAAASVAAAALAVEKNPASAAAQMTLIARRPVPGASAAALTWLPANGLASIAAADALVALANAGRVQDPAIRLRARQIARDRLEGPAGRHGGDQAPWARLLIAVGSWDDASLAVTFLPLDEDAAGRGLPGRIGEQPSGFLAQQEASGDAQDG